MTLLITVWHIWVYFILFLNINVYCIYTIFVYICIAHFTVDLFFLFCFWPYLLLYGKCSVCEVFCFIPFTVRSERYKWTLIILANFSLPICLSAMEISIYIGQKLHRPSPDPWARAPDDRWGNSSASLAGQHGSLFLQQESTPLHLPKPPAAGVTGLLSRPQLGLFSWVSGIHEVWITAGFWATVRGQWQVTMPEDRCLASSRFGWLAWLHYFIPKRYHSSVLSMTCLILEIREKLSGNELHHKWMLRKEKDEKCTWSFKSFR